MSAMNSMSGKNRELREEFLNVIIPQEELIYSIRAGVPIVCAQLPVSQP